VRGNGVRVFDPPVVGTISATAFRFLWLGEWASLLDTWCRSPRGASFLCLCKERTKETHPRRHALRAARSGYASGPGIFVRHIPVPYENAAIHGGALRVLPGPLAVPQGGPKATTNSKKARIEPSGQLLGPLRSGSHGGSNPQGGAQDVRRFRMGQDGPYENSRRDCAPAALRRADRRGVLSFAYFSLHKQRKVRPRGERTMPGRSRRCAAGLAKHRCIAPAPHALAHTLHACRR
jgi:hypothetical protein